MRFLEFRIPLTEAKVGRNLQHLEDLVFVDGSEGALEALDILSGFEKDVGDVSIKWDGTPAVIFGRDESGDFILTDLAGFGSKSYDGKVKSADSLEKMLLSRGKEVDDSRRAYAKSMADIWDTFENAVPSNFRGFMLGDLLYKTQPPIQDGAFVFKPNKVTYTVNADSDIGKRIAQSDVGVVIHTYTDLENNTKPADADMLNDGRLFVMPPVIAQQSPNIDVKGIEQLKNAVKQNAQTIDNFLNPVPGLSDMKNIIYTYVNQMSRARKLNQLDSEFFDWLKNSKVSAPKQAKILALHQSNPKALSTIFGLIRKIMAMKDQVIDQLDSADTDVKASTDGKPGGEGYVAAKSKTKLVPRTRWTPS
jgi:hypothetical protein